MIGYHDGSLEEHERRKRASDARLEMARRTAARPGSLAERKWKEREREARAGVKLVGLAMIILLAVILLVILGIVANLSAEVVPGEQLIVPAESSIVPGESDTVQGYMILRVADVSHADELNITLWQPGEPFVGPPAELKRSRLSLWLRAEYGISAKSPAFWIATAATIAGGILLYQLHLSMEGAP
jgi:hypothetical protein